MNLSKSQILPTCVLTLAFALVGCASPGSYAVLLPSPDGSVGKIAVQGPGGTQVLTQAMTGAGIEGGKPPFEVTQEQLTRDFGAAISARPTLPEQFMLYFEQGSQLTAESQALLQQVLERARARSNLDISVIGHTDTQGDATANETLALARATAMAERLKQLGLQNAVLAVESHGERNLLVKTPDDTAEVRNRRVEITLR